jgi:uncharacterized repeat protein (TIGR02543 family)
MSGENTHDNWVCIDFGQILYNYCTNGYYFTDSTVTLYIYYKYSNGTAISTDTTTTNSRYRQWWTYDTDYSYGFVDNGSDTTVTAKSYTLTSVPTQSGYTYKWDLSSTGSGTKTTGSTITISANTDVFAIRIANTYTATFSYGNGSSDTTTTATYAATLTLPTQPTRTGYTFGGWNDGTSTFTSGITYNYTSAKTFTAVWTANTYTATFSYGNGSSDTTTTATYAAALTLPTQPTRTGYTFGGWNDGTSTFTSGITYNYTSAKTFTAVWTANTYTATFSYGNGSSDTTTTATYAAALTLPTQPTRTGYTFGGWNDGTSTFTSGITYNYAAAKTFTAVWTANTYTATFSYGNGSSNTTTTATYAAALTLPTQPTRTGYTFGGWNDGTSTFASGITYNYAAAKTFTAVWTANTYTATFSYGNGSSDTTTTATYAAALTLPTQPTRTGYTFGGWNDGTTTFASGITYNYAANKTFTAVWSGISYTATFSYGNGSSDTTTTVTNGSSLTLPTQPTRTGYTFGGWNDGTTTFASGITYNYAANKTFTAVWTANTYTATFSYGNGSSDTTTTATYAATLTLPTQPTRTGYTFGGWNDGTSTFASGITYNYAAAKTFTAVWTANTYTATFSYGNGSSDTTTTATYAAALTLPTQPTRTGYTFGGWNDGTSTFAAGITYNYTSAKTFTAVWTANTYTATFSYGNGSSDTTTTATYAAALTLPTQPTRTGYTFGGWNDGTSTFAAGITYNYASAKTFTAVWTLNTYILTLDSNGKGTGRNISAVFGSNISVPTLKAVGYTFDGYYNEAAVNTLVVSPGNTYSMPSANKTLYAKWIDNVMVKFSDLQNTYGGTNPISISEYQSLISKASATETKLVSDFKGKGPAPLL